MELPTREQFAAWLKEARVSRRLQRDLRYIPEEISYNDARDFLAVRTKAGNEGIIIYEGLVRPFTLERRGPNASGRVEAIICDICATWQRGTNSAILTLKMDATHTVSHLVCADLDCSLHVRDITSQGKLSRSQLREHIDESARIVRLNERLGSILGWGENKS